MKYLTHFFEIIKTVWVLVYSFDVVALFTMEPVKETLNPLIENFSGSVLVYSHYNLFQVGQPNQRTTGWSTYGKSSKLRDCEVPHGFS